jgi:hypothetical protein
VLNPRRDRPKPCGNLANNVDDLTCKPSLPMRLPIPRFTLLQFLLVVPCLGFCLALAWEIVLNAPIGGLGTIYSQNYDETKFQRLREGMTAKQVEEIMGPPLKKVFTNQHMDAHDEGMWYYSNQRNATANFWRRWVLLEKGKAKLIINDYRYD